ncbi:hypothetical protein EJ07DRAFT_168227 [Lizonia empirigonia]|nr:hypothetical protein EJ07DRAFT_168227 [Lizonia empirigonia]
MLPSTAELVARFLRTNGYNDTLKSFLKEAGLPPDTGAGSNSSVTIESILQEKKTFDLGLNFEKLGVEDGKSIWTVPAPTKPIALESLPTRSNILSVAVFDLLLHSATTVKQYVAITTADRRLHLLNPVSPDLELIHSYTSFQDSPILDIVVLGSRYMMVASMSGKMWLHDTASDKVLDERKDHTKYVVKVAYWSDGDSAIIASAGWDSKIFFYRIDIGGDAPRLGEPWAIPEDGSPILLVARRDSTFLYYYSVPDKNTPAFHLLGKQNLAPHSNAWVAFTPADVQICPTDPSVVAVATSSTPHMKLLILKLLIPPARPTISDAGTESGASEPIAVTQASQACAELLIAEREEAAISVNVSTMAPQTAYSTPRLTWRPDGSGLYVSSDDGVIRGFETSTGKLVESLEGHEPGSKIRCLSTGYFRVPHGEDFDPASSHEFLISGGFDQKLILWDR